LLLARTRETCQYTVGEVLLAGKVSCLEFVASVVFCCIKTEI